MRILIIEDDAAIAANLYDFLESAGYGPDLARDGAQGLHLAVTQRWDAILLDLSLPAVDGLTICRKLRKEVLLDTPILILTARDTLDDKLQGFEQRRGRLSRQTVFTQGGGRTPRCTDQAL